MARHVFFSFHYARDLWRTNVVRNSGQVQGTSAAGFRDASLWEATKKKGDAAVKTLIDAGLVGTSVTVVLIGTQTHQRKYVTYEINKSIALGHGLLGVRIHNIEDQSGNTDLWGSAPGALSAARVPIYNYQYGKLGKWVEEAYQAACG